MVGRQSTTGGHREVVDHAGQPQDLAYALRLWRLALIEQAQVGEDDRVEEAQLPGEIALVAVEAHLRTRRGRECIRGGHHVQVPGADGRHGEGSRRDEGQPGPLTRRQRGGGLEVGAVDGRHVVGHGAAHRLGSAVGCGCALLGHVAGR